MIYTPENSPGSITVDVEKGEYIYDVLAVDMDNATVEVIDRPLRMVGGTVGIATQKFYFGMIRRLENIGGTGSALFLCYWHELSADVEPDKNQEIQLDTKE